MDVPLIDVKAQRALSALSSPYDSDAYNTADARIHFGPLRSPEKKFVSTVARPSSLHAQGGDSLLRRSPRLSSPRPMPPLRATMIVSTTKDGDVSAELQNRGSRDTRLSCLGTPDNEQTLQDEPSSILASRIIRAQDNPSPPPNSTKFMMADGASASVSPTPPLARSPHPELPFGDDSGSKSGSSTQAVRGRSVEFPTTGTNAVATPDLISFDSFSDSNQAAYPDDIPSIGNLFTRSLSPAPPRIDATLSLPLVTLTHSNTGESDTPEEILEMTPESVDEQNLIRSLFPDADEMLENSPRPEKHYSPEAFHPRELNDAETHANALMQSSSPQYTCDAGLMMEEGEALLLNDRADNVGTLGKKKEGRRPDVSIEAELIADFEVILPQDEDGGTRLPITDVPIQDRATRKRDWDILKTPTQADYRELGSLSPTSTNLLTQLLPSPQRGTMPVLEARTYGNASEQIPKSPQLITSFPQLLPTPRTPISSTNPVRFSSPVRGNPPQSLNKLRLQPAALDDPSRTPAKRITIDEAVAQGHISPQKATRLTADAGRALVFNIRPTDSPARRVKIAEASTPSSQKKWQGIRFGSPIRSVSRQRSTSIEPHAPVSSNGNNAYKTGSFQQPLSSKEPSFSRSQTIGSSSMVSSTTQRPIKLPFPIVASQPHLLSSTSEESEGEAKPSSPVKPPATSSSPIKSAFKQTTSKIPRGVKPYKRPPLSKPTDVEKSKPTMRMVELPKVGNSTRIISEPTNARADVVSGSLSNGYLESTSATSNEPSVSSTLKRKRVPEKASPVHKSRPVVLLRQVPKVVGPLPKSTDVIHAKKAVQPIRRVVDRRSEPPPVQPLPPGPDKGVHLDEEGVSKSIPEDASPETTPPLSPIKDVNASSSPPPPPFIEPAEEPSRSDTHRRTTRSRKPVKSVSADVFGGSESRSAPPRRKVKRQIIRSDGTLSSMTTIALKALTSLNTIKNQKYLAAKLETKVIRKEGTRPESPAVKIRTISQRLQDEKAKQRKERAVRRARRGDEGSPGLEQDEADGQSDSEGSSDWDDKNSSPSIRRHKRGPGEEEDYETPIRPERQAKRPRMGEEGEEALGEERRVKWDRGLFTMIYVDEVKVGTRLPPQGNLVKKGCLALTAKAAPLDNLGNLPESVAPLSELVEESVEVKKFVYDNDVEPLSPVIVVKNTRLRSKKAKS